MAIQKNSGWKNLKRGNISPQEMNKDEKPKPSGRHAAWKPGDVPNPKGNIETVFEARKRDDEIQKLAKNDPERVQEELYSELSLAALRLTRKLNRKGGEPSRVLVEAWREVRQAGLVVLEIRRTQGALTEAADFFSGLQTRIEAITPRLEASAEPIIEANS